MPFVPYLIFGIPQNLPPKRWKSHFGEYTFQNFPGEHAPGPPEHGSRLWRSHPPPTPPPQTKHPGYATVRSYSPPLQLAQIGIDFPCPGLYINDVYTSFACICAASFISTSSTFLFILYNFLLPSSSPPPHTHYLYFTKLISPPHTHTLFILHKANIIFVTKL